MKKIAFLNNKGGVGKTASVVTVAHMLATEYHKKTLIVDLDPQGNSSSMYADVDVINLLQQLLAGNNVNAGQKSIQDLLLDYQLDPHVAIHKTKYDNLDIIPAFLTLSEIEERLKADIQMPQQFRLKNHLEKLEEEYDYCIIDCSPSISIININGLAAADIVYIPIRCDAWSAVGITIAKNLIDTVKNYNPSLRLGGVFFTQYEAYKNVSKTVLEILQAFLGPDLMDIKISKSKLMEEMTYTQQPLLEYDSKRNAPVTLDYLKLTEYIMRN